jgi:hypothetical protein
MADELPEHDDLAEEKREAEHKLAVARWRLFSRLDEVGRRVRKVRSAIDVAQIVRNHPLAAIGVGLAAGALIGFPRRSKQGFLGAQLTALVTALVGTTLKTSIKSAMELPSAPN